jgi:hypothetical protein
MTPEQGGGDIFDEMGAILMQLVEMAGPEWVMAFLQAGMQEAQSAGGDQPPQPEMMSPGGPQAMPPMAGRTVGKPRAM